MKRDISKIYIALNKPKGFVCAKKDNLHPTIIDLLDNSYKNLHIVGRLDIDTTGIIILTNDGSYTHFATHPKKHITKVYEVVIKKPLNNDEIKIIENGMSIDHGKTKLKPATIKILEPNKVHLRITEGKFHQVKKMFFALKNEVISLHRIIFDSFDLSELNLKLGEYKEVKVINNFLK